MSLTPGEQLIEHVMNGKLGEKLWFLFCCGFFVIFFFFALIKTLLHSTSGEVQHFVFIFVDFFIEFCLKN